MGGHVAEEIGMSERRVRDILTGQSMRHDRRRRQLEKLGRQA